MREIRYWKTVQGRVASCRNSGFTLVEAMIVTAIAAIVMVVAAPSFKTFTNSTRISSASSLLLDDLNLARGEAIKRNVRVLVCLKNAAGDDCAAGTNWAPGWLVCYDRDTNASPNNGIPDGSCDVAPTDGTNPNPIVSRPAINSVLTLTGPSSPIRFNPNGSQGAPGTAASIALALTVNSSTPVTRTVTVAVTGHISKQ